MCCVLLERGVAGEQTQAAFLSSSALEEIYKSSVEHREQWKLYQQVTTWLNRAASAASAMENVSCEQADLPLPSQEVGTCPKQHCPSHSGSVNMVAFLRLCLPEVGGRCALCAAGVAGPLPALICFPHRCV